MSMFITQFPPNFSLLITPGSITTVKKSLTVFKMFKQVSKQLGFQVTRRHFSIGKQNNYKIAVCGANGGIGRPLSLLLRLNPMVTRLNLYDIVGTRGVAADLLHIDRTSKIQPFTGPKELAACLKHSDIVIIAAGFPRKPGMDRADLLKMNASVVVGIIDSIAKNCPKALIALITNPVNILVPIAAEVLFKRCEYDPQRLFGVSTLDVVRAQAFIGTSENVDPRSVQVEVIGGHSGKTIIPVISQSKPTFTKDVEKLVKRIQEAGTEVVKAKAGAGSATLSMAFSGARFVNSLMRGMAGENNIIECSYVESNVTEARFFATPILLGPNGIKKNLGLPDLSDFEKKLLKAAMPEILANIKTGIDFVESEID